MAESHHYDPRLLISDNLCLRTLLARIGSPQTQQKDLPGLVRSAYRMLLAEALPAVFPRQETEWPTRMAALEPRAVIHGPLLCQQTKLVIAAVIRGGILPAQTCYEVACELLPQENVRLDFLNMARSTDHAGRVTGVTYSGSKIGGPVEDAVLIIPDPMAATGGTVDRTLRVYQDLPSGPPRQSLALHMMATPEAVQRLLPTWQSLRIVAGRFDRGLSPDDVLATPPGTHPDQERGLTSNQYIVPGAGGVGELLTNSWV